MTKKPSCIKSFESLLGYIFQDKGLLEEALTHASARAERGGRDNERLEFLGDRVLGLAVASMLYDLLPGAREVEFARRFNFLVRKETCAAIAERIDLGSRIIMAASEARSGGRKKAVILADACEALLGAIYLDGGFEVAAAAVRRLWSPLLETAEMPAADAKTALQEYAQSRRLGLPQYREIDRTGVDHAPNFTVEVTVKGITPARGVGPSLKRAQQAAAETLLIREAVWPREREHA